MSSRLHEYNALLDTTRMERDAMLKEKALQQKLPARVAARFQLPDDESRHIVLVQGEISEILNSNFVVTPDVIINSENEYMVLGRLFDKNFSGALRYLDAEKDAAHKVIDDTLEKRLNEKLAAEGVSPPVDLGAVFETETAGLSQFGVKYVFHVATVRPSRQRGFKADLSEIPFVIQRCFVKYLKLLREGKDITSMLFPLIGTGDGGASSEDSAREMVPSIVSQMNSHKGIRETYIVAFRQGDLEALLDAAKASNLVAEK
jgi:O-acetyl-ADP-ribose deacetylase (regulator of RNase III)